MRYVSMEVWCSVLMLNCNLAIANHDRELALAIHVDILTRSSGDDITLWMSGVKQLIMRL